MRARGAARGALAVLAPSLAPWARRRAVRSAWFGAVTALASSLAPWARRRAVRSAWFGAVTALASSLAPWARRRAVRSAWFGAVTALASSLTACARDEPPGVGVAAAASLVVAPPSSSPLPPAPPPEAVRDPDDDALPFTPETTVDATGGVVVRALAMPTFIYDLPDSTKRKLGYARPGAELHRAEAPVLAGKGKCKAWYRVAPRGFVCDNAELTQDAEHPLLRTITRRPRRGEGLPYLYARARPSPPHYYVRVPTRAMQRSVEGDDLAEQLAKVSRPLLTAQIGELAPLPETLTMGAAIPRPVNLWFKGRQGPTRGRASPRSMFAFLSAHDVEGRLFGLTTDMDLIALDRVRVVTEPPMHGGEVSDLPAAITRQATPRYRDGVADGAFEAYAALSLQEVPTGEQAETTDGARVTTRHLVVFKPRKSFPAWAREGEKWVDVSIREQTLVAYEGTRAVYVARVSTGAGGEDDPETTTATIQGYFRIQSKHVTTTMLGNRADTAEYELLDVPYVQYFHGGYALHAAYWHDRFGQPRSHGCINLPPKDAAWLFEWTEPKVPEEWHGIEANGQGTLVYTHP